MDTKTYVITNSYEPSLSSEDWRILQGARFAALPQAVQSKIRALKLSDGAQLVFQDLFALAVRDKFEGNLAIQRPRHILESLSNKTRSTYSRILKELEQAGLIVRRMTRHPATRYAQGWTVIFIQLPTDTWQAMRADQYRSAQPRPSYSQQSIDSDNGNNPDQNTSQLKGNQKTSAPPYVKSKEWGNENNTEQIVTPNRGQQNHSETDKNNVISTDDQEAQSKNEPDTKQKDEDTTGPINDPLNSAKEAYQLWITSDAAAECRVAPMEIVKPICQALAGVELIGDQNQRRNVIREKLNQVPEVDDISHDELADALARRSIKRTNPKQTTQKQKTVNPTCIPSELVQTIKDRAGRIGIEEDTMVFEVAYSVFCGVFQWHESRDRAIGSALKVIRKGQWQTPFGFDPSQCRSQHDGSIVLTA